MRPRRVVRFLLLLALAAASRPRAAVAQLAPLAQDRGGVGLGLALRRLPVTASVLYVTAHPDDENNGVLVALSRGRGVRTGLLTLTRGDGGQNEIGPELFEALGILRSEELAAVHRYDAAEQYYTRAYEFGYSFSVEETLQKWGRDEILQDVVRVVRAFRPDVMLTLPLEAPGGGQHHQAAARLAQEAFRVAADPQRYPEQLRAGLRPWQARKLYQGAVGASGARIAETALVMKTGVFDPLLGMTWAEFGSLARAQHRCQGVSQLKAAPGDGQGAYVLLDSEPRVAAAAESDLLEGVDEGLAALARFAPPAGVAAPWLADGLGRIARAASDAQAAYDAREPGRTLAALREGLSASRRLAETARASALAAEARSELGERLQRKAADFESALALAHGLALEPIVDDGDAVPGQVVTLKTRVWNGGAEPIELGSLELQMPRGWTLESSDAAARTLPPSEAATLVHQVRVAPDARYSQPYWRRNPKQDRYDVLVPGDVTLPWSPPELVASLRYRTGGVGAALDRPVHARYQGRWVGGEKQKLLNVVPALSVRLTPEIAVVPLSTPGVRREFRAAVSNNAAGARNAVVRLEAPRGWRVEPPEVPIAFRYEGEEVTTRFFVTPPRRLEPGEQALRAVAVTGGAEFREGYQVIAYHHTQERHLFRPAVARVLALDARVAPGTHVGYVSGAGDEVAEALAQIGARVTFLSPEDIAFGDLSRVPLIVTGIRAYQTRPELKAYHQRLMEWVAAGGHLVVQYNKLDFNQLTELPQAGGFSGAGALQASPFAPYPAAISTSRVTAEDAPVRLLAPAHPLLSTPNRIGEDDFAGWVQERGLYLLDARDPRYTQLLSATDPFPKNPGEKNGLLVTAAVGKGTWSYVGLGLFRQLPAGTPGAYRILANLVSRPGVGATTPRPRRVTSKP